VVHNSLRPTKFSANLLPLVYRIGITYFNITMTLFQRFVSALWVVWHIQLLPQAYIYGFRSLSFLPITHTFLFHFKELIEVCLLLLSHRIGINEILRSAAAAAATRANAPAARVCQLHVTRSLPVTKRRSDVVHHQSFTRHQGKQSTELD
jgi:hypothetical protein